LLVAYPDLETSQGIGFDAGITKLSLCKLEGEKLSLCKLVGEKLSLHKLEGEKPIHSQ